MKKHILFSIAILIIISATSFNLLAQTASCCSKTSTAEFAMLSNNAAFKAGHESPIPFHYVSTNGKMITIKTKDGKDANAFEIKAANPTVNYLIVIHEWWGLNDYIKREAERLQNELTAVNVIALDLYDGKVATNPDEAAKFMGEAKEDRIRAIINGGIAYAGSSARIQTVGWCFGGGWSLQTSIAAGKQGAGCVMYYGMPEKDPAKLKMLNAPVLGLFASKDGWITPEIVKQFESDMKSNNKEITVKMFDADHAFANPSNPKYDKVAAAEANEMALAFLKKNLR
jgi:carboxymethylenebutenolidase